MSKSNVEDLVRAFNYAPSGKNEWSGLSPELPKRDIQPCVDAVALLDPIPAFGNGAIVIASQPGIYNESVTMVEGVLFSSVGVGLGSDQSYTLKLSSFSSSTNTSVFNTGGGSTTYLFDGLTLSSVNATLARTSGESSTVYNVQGSCEDIFINTEVTQVLGVDCIGLRFIGECTTPIVWSGARLDLLNENATGVEWNPSSSSEIGILDVSSINSRAVNVDIGLFVLGENTLGFNILAQAFSAICSTIEVTELCNIASGAFLTVLASDISANITVASGAELNLTASTSKGEITVAAGGILNAYLPNHGFTNPLVNLGTINGIINGIKYGNHQEQILFVAESFSMQIPDGLDDPLQIEFGGAQLGVSDPVMLSVAGLLTCNIAGQYRIRLDFQSGRFGAGSASWLFFRTKLNGSQFGSSKLVKLDNTNSDTPVEFSEVFNLESTDELMFEVMRDSQGNDSGELVTESPTPIDWTDSASAVLTVSR